MDLLITDRRHHAASRKAALLHRALSLRQHANARRFASDGYPWSLTPLPIAFSDDPQVYHRDSATTHGYEWMIGDALLATPLYGNDYATVTTRDIYLPAGQWMDFDTGQFYQGHQFLKHFALPANKTPLFVGGSGITLEERDGRLQLCIYPVAQEATTPLTLPNDPRPITVKVVGIAPGRSWTSAVITDSQHRSIAPVTGSHSIAFQPQPGETYEVRAIEPHRDER